MFSVQIIFHSSSFSGKLLHKTDESREHRFFSRNNLPNLLPNQEPFIQDWVNQVNLPAIK